MKEVNLWLYAKSKCWTRSNKAQVALWLY